MWSEWVDTDVHMTYKLYQPLMSGVCGFCESLELKQEEWTDFDEENVDLILRSEVVKWSIVGR
jgi:hypothetical protein